MARGKTGKWSRRSQDEWQTLLARFEASAMGVEAFCRREAISVASFYRWRSMLSNRGGGCERASSASAPVFVDLGTLNGASAPRSGLDLKLELGDGLILHLVRSCPESTYPSWNSVRTTRATSIETPTWRYVGLQLDSWNLRNHSVASRATMISGYWLEHSEEMLQSLARRKRSHSV